MQQILREELKLSMEVLEEKVAASEVRVYASNMVIDFLYHLVAQLLDLLSFILDIGRYR